MAHGLVILVSGASATMRDYRGQSGLGVFVSPRSRNRIERSLWPGAVWAADNGAYKGQFHAGRFVRMLERLRHVPNCRFVAAPDVVADADRTRRLFDVWQPMIRALGFPVALVAQDGLTPAAVPWGRLEALFIGGSTEWKLSRPARTLVGCAKARGKWVHMGRVNTRRRLHYAERIGCDSVDGTTFSRYPAVKIPPALRWMAPLPLFREGG